MTEPWRIVVLISGAGRTLSYLLDAVESGAMSAEIAGVVSSRSDVLGVQVAKSAGLPCRIVLPRNYENRTEFNNALFAAVSQFEPDLVLLAGFLRQLDITEAWNGRVLNIHPSLLPETLDYAAGKGMYGLRVHQAVLEHGDKVSGATVHEVTAVYDSGPPILKSMVPVLDGDTAESLADRVFEAEKVLYPAAFTKFTEANPSLKRR